MATNPKRRQLITGLGAMMIAPVVNAADKFNPTPRQSSGPFYPVEIPLDDDNDLTYVSGESQPALGQWTDLSGRILDINGEALSGLRIEIWQCDVNGRYRHPGDQAKRPLDPGFQGHGHTISNQQGEYHFRTIRPEEYPGRTPHIHVAVYPQAAPPFITQIYIADDPRNPGDILFRQIPVEQRQHVVAEFQPVTTGKVQFKAEFNLILDPASGRAQT